MESDDFTIYANRRGNDISKFKYFLSSSFLKERSDKYLLNRSRYSSLLNCSFNQQWLLLRSPTEPKQLVSPRQSKQDIESSKFSEKEQKAQRVHLSHLRHP